MQLLLKSFRRSGPQFLTVWQFHQINKHGKTRRKCVLHKEPPELLLEDASAYMRTCSKLEPSCSFWQQLSEFAWMPRFVI